jgi:hypothetical protein
VIENLNYVGGIYDVQDGCENPDTVSATLHTGNFVDAVLDGKPVNAPLNAGVEATLPVQMALRSYWTRKTVTSSEMV